MYTNVLQTEYSVLGKTVLLNLHIDSRNNTTNVGHYLLCISFIQYARFILIINILLF